MKYVQAFAMAQISNFDLQTKMIQLQDNGAKIKDVKFQDPSFEEKGSIRFDVLIIYEE